MLLSTKLQDCKRHTNHAIIGTSGLITFPEAIFKKAKGAENRKERK